VVSAETQVDYADNRYPPSTLDCHIATAQVDAVAMAQRMASQLTHLRLADGSGGVPPRDEHVPGQSNQPCAEVCRALAERIGRHRGARREYHFVGRRRIIFLSSSMPSSTKRRSTSRLEGPLT
jgi:hypothetical protein